MDYSFPRDIENIPVNVENMAHVSLSTLPSKIKYDFHYRSGESNGVVQGVMPHEFAQRVTGLNVEPSKLRLHAFVNSESRKYNYYGGAD